MTAASALRWLCTDASGTLLAKRPSQTSRPPYSITTVVAGAKLLGTNTYSIPGDAVYVSASGSDTTGAGTFGNPYATVTKGISMATTGSKTVAVRGGTYRESLTTDSGKTVTVIPHSALGVSEQVWFDGAKVATSWTNLGNGTYRTPYSAVFTRFSPHAGTNPLRNYADQCWINDIALTQISSGTPNAGQFIVDQAGHTLTIGTNPAGKTVEVSDLRVGLVASGVTNLYGVGFRKYSPDAMEWLNTILTYAGNSQTSVVKDCWLQQCAMAAVNVACNSITFQQNTIQDMGWAGVTGNTCDLSIVSRNLVRRFNQGGWSPEPACAGIKLTRGDQIEMSQNWIEDGPGVYGIWLDVFCTRYKITNNVIKGDALTGGARMGGGIMTEISDGGYFGGTQYKSYIVGNRITNCASWGLLSFDSGWNMVYNNESTGCAVAIYLWQDNRVNNGGEYRSATESPCKTLHNEVCNNKTSSGYSYNIQFLAYDDGGVVNSKGGDMIDKYGGNWHQPAGGGSVSQWGLTGGGRTAANTQAAMAALDSSVGGPLGSKLGTISIGTTAPDPTTTAEAAPATVATILGIGTGDKLIGVVEAKLPVIAA